MADRRKRGHVGSGRIWRKRLFVTTLMFLLLFRFAGFLPSHAQSQPDFALIEEAWDMIKKVYVDHGAVDSRALTYGAISGMVQALGDTGHSTFLSPTMLKAQSNSTKGKFEGIGAEVRIKDGQLVVVAPLDGSPAQRSGLRSGDIILKVNGENIVGLPLTQSVEKILGPAGTPVTMTILRPSSGTTREVTIVRASITPRYVTWGRLPGSNVALVRISSFRKGIAEDLRKVLEKVKQEQLPGIILDLRNNPGGMLDEAIKVASQFLKDGNVLLERNAQGELTPISVRSECVLPDLPSVVLVNGGSASASEIVAGALRDARRAELVGETTFGTGTVLEEFYLSDGSALLLAVKEWLTPGGRTIWHKGITPDVEVSLPINVSPLLPETVNGMTREALTKSGDTQLLRALDILEKKAGYGTGALV